MSIYRVKIGSEDLSLPLEIVQAGWNGVLVKRREDGTRQYIEEHKADTVLACKHMPGSWGADPYAVILEAENTCAVFQYVIEVYCNEEWISRWEGEFNARDWKSNRDKEKSISFKPSQNQLLQCLKSEWTDPVNMFAAGDVQAIRAPDHKYETTEVQVEGTISGVQPAVPFVPHYCFTGKITTIVHPLGGAFPTYFFHYHRLIGQGTCDGLTPVPPQDFYAWSYLSGSCPDPLFWACPSGSGHVPFSFPNGRYLSDVLLFMLEETDCEITLVSNFFNINPDATQPDNEAYDKAAEFYQELMVFQKSDIKRHDATNPSSGPSWTMKLRDLILDLCVQFNMSYSLSEDGTFRLEHISYFDAQPGTDYTGFPMQRVLEQDKSQIPGKIRFQYRDEDANGTFNGVPITIHCGEGETEKRLSLFSNDINYIADDVNAESVGDDGFCLVATHLVDDEPQVFTYNLPMSWPELQLNFWRWNMPGPGLISGQEVDPLSYAKTRKQPPFSVTACCDDLPDPTEYIITELGNGDVEQIEHDLKKDIITISAIY